LGGEFPAGYQVVGIDWFETLGVPLREGRLFTAGDSGEHTQVAVINQALADRLWPRGRAVGRRLRTGANEPWLTVVGVVANLRHLGPKQPPRPEIYEPLAQRAFSFTAVAVRVTGDPASYADAFRREVASLDPSQPISNVKTMREHLQHAQSETRALSALTTLFGGLALLIAALGIYSALGFSVALRMREFGVRLALGASPHRVRRDVLRESVVTTGVGIGAGLAVAFVGARAIRGLLFDTSAGDPGAYVLASIALTAVAIAAGYIPARHAMRADPASVLKSE
jgi:ABC-type antimicrobial peptide transport system permease subunit